MPDHPTVPLRLAAPPVLSEANGRPAILLSLHESTSQKVIEFTAAHLGGQMAVVIGGEAVTVHKIREPTLTSQVQITSCTEGGLEQLWEALHEARDS